MEDELKIEDVSYVQQGNRYYVIVSLHRGMHVGESVTLKYQNKSTEKILKLISPAHHTLTDKNINPKNSTRLVFVFEALTALTAMKQVTLEVFVPSSPSPVTSVTLEVYPFSGQTIPISAVPTESTVYQYAAVELTVEFRLVLPGTGNTYYTISGVPAGSMVVTDVVATDPSRPSILSTPSNPGIWVLRGNEADNQGNVPYQMVRITRNDRWDRDFTLKIYKATEGDMGIPDIHITIRRN
jgi:hypothetical protein